MKSLAYVACVSVIVLTGLTAQGHTWIHSPVNGHYYARLPVTNSWGESAAAAGSIGVELATVRNAAENAWIVNNILGGQACWLGMDCNRTWTSGWPVDWVPAGSDGPNCWVWPCFSSYNFGINANGSWHRWCSDDDRYAVLEYDPTVRYEWSALPSASAPSARSAAMMVYDDARGVSVYFGGKDIVARNDTWEWSPALGWVPKITFNNPPAREKGAFAYDPAHGVSALFGGLANNGALADTWTWNGTNWTQLNPAVSPPARHTADMVFDHARGVLVLFGGRDSQGTNYGDTWEFDGVTWTNVVTANAPNGRYGHAMFYDGVDQRVVLFGGQENTALSDETWTYDGTNWVLQSHSVRPPPLSHMATAYDWSSRRGVIVGGWTGSGKYDRVWAYLGFNWHLLHQAQLPVARSEASMTYHEDRLYLVGGYSNVASLHDPWIGRINPDVTIFGSGCGTPPLAIQTTASLPVIGSTFTLGVANVTPGAIVTMMSIGFSRTNFGAFSLPLPLDGIGMPGCWLNQDAAHRLGEFCYATGVGTAAFDLPIANLPSLIGLRAYFQPWIFDPSVNAAWILSGNAADVTISGS